MVLVINLLAVVSMTLKNKIALIVAACTLLMLGSYYLLSLQSARHAVVDFNKRSAITMAKLELDNDEVEAYLQQLAHNTSSELLNTLVKQFDGYAFMLVDNQRLISSSLPDSLQLSAEPQSTGFQFTIHQPNMPPSVITIPSAPTPVHLKQHAQAGLYWLPLAWLDLGQQQDQLTTYLNNRFMQLFLLLSCVAVLLAWLGTRWLLQPIHLLLDSFAMLRSGQLSWRIQSQRTDELGQLFSGFNHLADGLQRLDQQYRRMSADLAHELRTPLTAVVGRLEAMQDGIVPTNHSQLTQLQTDVQRISRIIDDLNLLSLSEAGQLQLNLQSVDVATLLSQLQQSYQAQADAKGVSFIVQSQTGLAVLADAGRLTQVLSNLLNNAFRYAVHDAAPCCIRLTAQQVANQIEIQLTDNGPGLTPELQAALFQRFNHARSQGGSGLGLAICQQLCQLMQADIQASAVTGGGLGITIRFAAVGKM